MHDLDLYSPFQSTSSDDTTRNTQEIFVAFLVFSVQFYRDHFHNNPTQSLELPARYATGAQYLWLGHYLNRLTVRSLIQVKSAMKYRRFLQREAAYAVCYYSCRDDSSHMNEFRSLGQVY